MPASSSTPAATSQQPQKLDDPVVVRRVLTKISLVMALKMMSAAVTVNARPELFLKMFNNNSAAVANKLGTITAAGALLEFLLGPMLGRFSDAFGRKKALLLAPFMTLAGSTAVCLAPTNLTVHTMSRILTIAFDTAFFSAFRASMADVMSGSNIAQNAFLYMGVAGLSVPLSPAIAGRLSPVGNYKFSAACAAVASLLVVTTLEETLPQSNRLPLDIASCSPLAFLRLFTNGPEMFWLALCSGLQTFSDYRLVEETSTLVMRDRLGWKRQQISSFLSLVGIYITMAPLASKFTIKALGRLGHTTLSNVCNVLGYALWASADSAWSMKMAQVPLVFGGRKRDGVETLISDIGCHSCKMGKGELESYKMNMRSVANFLAPVVYSRLFSYGKSAGQLGAPFWGAVIFSVLAELAFRQVPQKRLISLIPAGSKI